MQQLSKYKKNHIFCFSGNPDYDYWWYLNENGWADEMGGMKKMIGAYANIPEDVDIGN